MLVLVSFQGNQKEGSIDRLLVFLVWQIVEYIFAIIIWSSFGYIRRKERKKRQDERDRERQNDCIAFGFKVIDRLTFGDEGSSSWTEEID